MADIHITEVHLLQVPLENDYKHTLFFDGEFSQRSYFYERRLKSYTDFSYQRKDHTIRVPEHYDNIQNCNYVMYKNVNKWYYAFITDIRYISEGVSEIEIETDVMQTWAFDYTVKPSFVEREHVSEDTAGLHTYPEGLETGDFICNAKDYDGNLLDLCIIMAYNDFASGSTKYTVKGDIWGGIYSGMKYTYNPMTDSGVESLNDILSDYDKGAMGDGINSIFMCPTVLALGTNYDPTSGGMTLGKKEAPESYTKSVAKLTSLNGYTPRNKKLLTYPYVSLNVSNNAGMTVPYHQELFSGDKCTFNIAGVVTPGCSIRLNPTNYKGASINQDEGMPGPKFPICCWNSDTYTNWLTQNSVNLITTAGAGFVGAVGGATVGAIAGGPLGAIAGASGGVQSILGVIGQIHAAQHVPDQVKGNANSGDVITGSGDNTFMFYSMSIKKEFAEIIDSYFDMFGYKVCKVKKPNSEHRAKYWYTKTIDVNIDGNFNQKDLQKIKDAYNNGITFWKNPSEINNYSKDVVAGNVPQAGTGLE